MEGAVRLEMREEEGDGISAGLVQCTSAHYLQCPVDILYAPTVSQNRI